MLVFVFYLVISTPDVKIWKSKHPQKTSYMTYREKDKNYIKIRNKVFYKWIPLSLVPDLMQKTIIVSEDASFWSHQGIDWYEIQESLKKNIREGGFLRGGSTITQQVARNLYLTPEKNIGRKIREWVITTELEKSLKKSEILELYVNIAEWGYNIFGINAASQYYFQKSPQELTLTEMVRLTAVLPNPLDMKPNRLKRSIYWRSKVILERLKKFDYIDDNQYEHTLAELDGLYTG
jgi:monofunctional biosynthetic peptidoglycan transglycosylase